MDTNSKRRFIANLQSFRTMVLGGLQFAIANPQQVFPLAKLSLKAHALGDLEARDDTPLDLLAGLSGSFPRSSVLPAGLIEVETNRSRSRLSKKSSLRGR